MGGLAKDRNSINDRVITHCMKLPILWTIALIQVYPSASSPSDILITFQTLTYRLYGLGQLTHIYFTISLGVTDQNCISTAAWWMYGYVETLTLNESDV